MLRPYGEPCPRVLSITVARRHEADALSMWLDALPHSHKLCAAICLKGMRCNDSATAASLSKLRHMRLHSCVEEPGGNENGHEGVCAFRFLLDNYNRSWRNVFFLHGDVAPQAQKGGSIGKHGSQFAAFRQFLLRDEWPAWPAERWKMTSAICGCGLVGQQLSPFGPKDFWFTAIAWWLGNFVSLRDANAAASVESWMAASNCVASRHSWGHSNLSKTQHQRQCYRSGVGAYMLHNGSLSSPLGYMFNLDRKSALQRSLPFLRAQYRMNLKGVRVLPPGWSGARQAVRIPLPGFTYNPLVWGHVNERLPYFQFGHEYVERPVPPCIWEGPSEIMNCSQSDPLLTDSKALRDELMKQPKARAQHPRGCDAFANCGSTG